MSSDDDDNNKENDGNNDTWHIHIYWEITTEGKMRSEKKSWMLILHMYRIIYELVRICHCLECVVVRSWTELSQVGKKECMGVGCVCLCVSVCFFSARAKIIYYWWSSFISLFALTALHRQTIWKMCNKFSWLDNDTQTHTERDRERETLNVHWSS